MKTVEQIKKELDRLMRYQDSIDSSDTMFLVTWREIHKLNWVLGDDK